MIAALFGRGHAADLILGVMLAEAVWLRLRREWRVSDIAGLLLPGALIVLALRGAMTGADWPAIALPLILSLPAHAIDVRWRDRHAGSSSVRSSISDRR